MLLFLETNSILVQIVDEKSLIKKYQNEIHRLKEELERLKNGIVSVPQPKGSSGEDIVLLRQKVYRGLIYPDLSFKYSGFLLCKIIIHLANFCWRFDIKLCLFKSTEILLGRDMLSSYGLCLGRIWAWQLVLIIYYCLVVWFSHCPNRCTLVYHWSLLINCPSDPPRCVLNKVTI